MLIDFVKTPYTTGPNMVRNTGPVFISPPDQKIIKAKKIQLELYNTDLWAQTDPSVVKQAAEYCNVYTDNIVDLSLRLEEDVAIMHKGQLSAICFCFPSGFKPSERIGMMLEDIHRPVADSELLVRASPGISRVMTEQSSFVRYVWTVTNNSNLSNHPSEKIIDIPNSIDDLFFRWEKQTTAKVNNDTSLFFVHVNVVPLKEIWSNKILESINSMTENVLEYKNLLHIKKLLNSTPVNL